jgi:FAD/FMN-containing dehydrogenase
MIACWSGDPDRADEVLAPLDDWGEVIGRFVGPMPYPLINTLFDDLLCFGLRHYWKSLVAADVSDAAIEAHMPFVPTVPTVESGVFFHPIDGACHDTGPAESAFPHRDARFLVGVYGSWHRNDEDDAVTEWVRSCHGALRPHYLDSDYVNFAPVEPGAVRAIFRQNYDRLTNVKARYDPQNVFRHNQNVPPASVTPG